MPTYNFTKSPVCAKRLSAEIKTALPTKTFRLSVEGSSVDCIFDDILDSGEETTLETTVTSHDGAVISFRERYEIKELDKQTRRILKITWYAVENSGVYSYPVREVTYTYEDEVVLSETEKRFSLTGAEISSVTREYYTEKLGQTIYLRTKEV